MVVKNQDMKEQEKKKIANALDTKVFGNLM